MAAMETAVETRVEAARLDAQLVPVDWSQPDPRATPFRFDAPSGSLAAWSMGDPVNPRVVLVPGATGSKEDFVLLAPPLVDAGYFVQSFDLAGQFESASAGPSPRSGHWDYPLFLDDLVAFLEAGEPAHVLGYSFAGILAQLVLASRRDLILSLTLLTAPPLTGNVFRGVKIVGPFARFASPRVGAGLMMHTPDVTAEVAAAGVPLLIATGHHDLWPVRLHAEYADRIGAELAVYRTGHSPCETTPNQLALDMIATFRRAELLA